MAETPTAGQVAYEAYWHAAAPYMHPWADVHPQNQAAWEAAAQAVLRQAGVLVLDFDPDVQREEDPPCP